MFNIKKYVLMLIAVSALTAAIALVQAAVPKPAVVPPQGVWQIDVQFHGPPQKIDIALPGDTKSKTYWYMLYTITNNTGRDIDFYPQFELFTDTFKLTAADVKPRLEIFDTIRNRYKKNIPLLEPPSSIAGPILQGQDNARDSVVVFDEFDPNANYVRIFISGLSNEAVAVDHPFDIDPKTKKPRQVLLRKTLMLEYQVPGDALNLENRLMLYRDRQWIMR